MSLKRKLETEDDGKLPSDLLSSRWAALGGGPWSLHPIRDLRTAFQADGLDVFQDARETFQNVPPMAVRKILNLDACVTSTFRTQLPEEMSRAIKDRWRVAHSATAGKLQTRRLIVIGLVERVLAPFRPLLSTDVEGYEEACVHIVKLLQRPVFIVVESKTGDLEQAKTQLFLKLFVAYAEKRMLDVATPMWGVVVAEHTWQVYVLDAPDQWRCSQKFVVTPNPEAGDFRPLSEALAFAVLTALYDGLKAMVPAFISVLETGTLNAPPSLLASPAAGTASSCCGFCCCSSPPSPGPSAAAGPACSGSPPLAPAAAGPAAPLPLAVSIMAPVPRFYEIAPEETTMSDSLAARAGLEQQWSQELKMAFPDIIAGFRHINLASSPAQATAAFVALQTRLFARLYPIVCDELPIAAFERALVEFAQRA